MGSIFRQDMSKTDPYSSCENYAYFENKDITCYIPTHGTYKGRPEGFQYFKEGNFWYNHRGSTPPFEIKKWKTATSDAT